LLERKSAEHRDRLTQIQAEIDRYGTADGKYTEAGIQLLELTRNMHRLFEKLKSNKPPKNAAY
jgi:hypothetical protein